MNDLQKFNFNDNPVSVIDRAGTTWFVAKDVCEVLEISKHRDAVSRLDEDERGSVLVDTLGGKQEMTTINESGLYKLVFRSRKKIAKAFTKWVTSEVIPSIRKNGGYIAPNANGEMVSALIEKWTAERISYITTIAEQSAELALVRRDNDMMIRAVSVVSPKYPFGSVSKRNGHRKTNFRRSAWYAPKSMEDIRADIVQLLLPLFQ